MRINEVEVTNEDWAFEAHHNVQKPDIFRMSGTLNEVITLQLNTRAKNLLLEEFPLAEKDLTRKDGKWVLTTVIQSLEGAGRFVVGLAADIKVLQGSLLMDYIRDYDQRFIQKL